MGDIRQMNNSPQRPPIQNKILPPRPPIQGPGQPQINKVPQQPAGAYNSGKNIKFLEPEIVEKKNWEMKHVGFALGLGFALIIVQFISMTIFNLEPVGAWILAFVLIVIFGIAVYFLMEPTIEKEIRQKIIETNLQTVDRPVVQEVIKTVEVEKPVVREVPIIKEVPVYRPQKTVYVARKERKTVVKRAPTIKYDFVGSKIQKVYHTSSCRLGKSIEKKYLVKAPTSSLFRRLKYKPCKVCKPNK